MNDKDSIICIPCKQCTKPFFFPRTDDWRQHACKFCQSGGLCDRCIDSKTGHCGLCTAWLATNPCIYRECTKPKECFALEHRDLPPLDKCPASDVLNELADEIEKVDDPDLRGRLCGLCKRAKIESENINTLVSLVRFYGSECPKCTDRKVISTRVRGEGTKSDPAISRCVCGACGHQWITICHCVYRI